ncbi:M23 family metallopeptidase [Oscillospiraceae bacterium MB08-C2-2]|nr:M23 family metallopeptidase [Oscillospiraceae bacterium MB08-C2-2]
MADKKTKKTPGQKPDKPIDPASADKVIHPSAKAKGAPKKGGKSKEAPRLSQVTVRRKVKKEAKPSLWDFTLLFIYKNLYILGVTLLRRGLRYRRQARLYWLHQKNAFFRWQRHTKARLHLLSGRLSRLVTSPIDKLRDAHSLMKTEAEACRAANHSPMRAYSKFIESVWHFVWTILRTVFNHVAPVVAVVFLITTVSNTTSRLMGLSVEYKGEIIGYIRREQDFTTVEKQVTNRVIDTGNFNLSYELPKFTLQEVSEDMITPAKTMVDRVIMASGDAIEQAYGLYINNVFQGAVTDKETLLQTLVEIRQQHATGRSGERMEFEKKVSVREGLYPTASVVPFETIGELINSYEAHEQIYLVQDGDTPTGIASKTGVPYSRLKEMNPGFGDATIVVGDEVRIAVARPFMSVKNIYKTTYREEFDYPVEEVKSSTHAIGYREVAKEGVSGVRQVTAEITTINGLEISRDILETKVLRDAVEERVIVGTNNPAAIISRAPSVSNEPGSTEVSSSGFIWPTNGGRITVGLNGYYGHTGVDIPRPVGTPVYASAAGYVTAVKYQNYAYGYHVMIDHGNGYSTLYAHNSSINVEVGDYVNQGDVIAGVGRTGNATGNHVHFEVRYKGKIMNPVNYIGNR